MNIGVVKLVFYIEAFDYLSLLKPLLSRPFMTNLIILFLALFFLKFRTLDFSPSTVLLFVLLNGGERTDLVYISVVHHLYTYDQECHERFSRYQKGAGVRYGVRRGGPEVGSRTSS